MLLHVCLSASLDQDKKYAFQVTRNFKTWMVGRKIFVTRHPKRYKLSGRRHFEKMRLKVHITSRKNSTPTRVSKRSLTSDKTGSKAFFMLRFSAARLTNILYDIKCLI